MRRSARLSVLLSVGLVAIFVSPLRAEAQEDGPVEIPSLSGTDRVLAHLGIDADVLYGMEGVDAIVRVRYRTGLADPATTAQQVAEAVWQNEQYRFVRLVVEPIAGSSTVFTYDELTFMFGPRPTGFDQIALGAVIAALGATGAWVGEPLGSSDDFIEAWIDGLIRFVTVWAAIIGIGLFLIAACFALGTRVATRRRERARRRGHLRTV
ncbi:MAG: hypothetical protein ACRDY6_14925 [Acidimicrobiia bacterium]